MTKYSKFLAGVAGLVVVAAQALADGHISTAEWGEIATAAVTAAAVWAVPNKATPS